MNSNDLRTIRDQFYTTAPVVLTEELPIIQHNTKSIRSVGRRRTDEACLLKKIDSRRLKQKKVQIASNSPI